MTHWRAIAVGCVAIWPVTVPKQHSHKGVAMLCPPVGDSRNLVRKGQGLVVVGGRLGLVLWGLYTMKRDMSIPLMIMVNCTFPITPSRLLPLVRRKMKTKQKTEKEICQCGLCWCHT